MSRTIKGQRLDIFIFAIKKGTIREGRVRGAGVGARIDRGKRERWLEERKRSGEGMSAPATATFAAKGGQGKE